MSGSAWNPGGSTPFVDAESTILSETFTVSVDGQVTFTLTEFTYQPNTGSLAVYRNGQKLTPNYITETSTSIVTLSASLLLAAGETIECVGLIGSTDANAQAAAQSAIAAANSAAAASIIETNLHSSSGSTLVGFIQAGLGAVAQLVQDVLREQVSVTNFGAVEGGVVDCSNAFMKALEYCLTYKKNCKIPAGIWLLNTKVAVATASSNHFSIIGDGSEVTTVIVADIAGGISVAYNSTNYSARCAVRGISFVTSLSGAGTALAITHVYGGDRHASNASFYDIITRGISPTTGYFVTGIDATGSWYPSFKEVYISGPYLSATGATLADGSIIYAQQNGILLTDCYSPIVKDCGIWSVSTALNNASSANPGPEGFRVINTVIANVKTGILFDRVSDEPNVTIDNCHINYRNNGIKVTNARSVRVRNTLFYNEDTSAYYATPADIYVMAGQTVSVSGNQFEFSGNPNRVCIDIGNNITEVSVSDNQFSCVAAIGARFGTGITVSSVENNEFNASVVLDVSDASNTVIISGRSNTTANTYEMSAYSVSSLAGVFFDLFKRKNTANGDAIAAMRFWGKNPVGTKTNYSAIRTAVKTATAGSEESYVEILTNNVSASPTVAMQVGNDGASIGGGGRMGTGTFNAPTAYYVAGTKVVGAQNTGWTAGTGTPLKGAFAASTVAEQRILAIEQALRTHGLIN